VSFLLKLVEEEKCKFWGQKLLDEGKVYLVGEEVPWLNKSFMNHYMKGERQPVQEGQKTEAVSHLAASSYLKSGLL